MVTALVPEIGYDEAANLARSAFESGRTVREVASEHPMFQNDAHKLNRRLDPQAQTDPHTKLNTEATLFASNSAVPNA
jgi:fumarate hydratase class II